MPVITLPDNSTREFDAPISVLDVALDIGPGLAKATLAGVVNGVTVDATHIIENDASVAIVTDRSDEALEVIRHSSAHLWRWLLEELFPSAQVTIGPVIEDGFYYDFSFERAFTPEDLEAIEKRMAELAKQDFPISREEGTETKLSTSLRALARPTKQKLLQVFPQMNPLAYIAKVNL